MTSVESQPSLSETVVGAKKRKLDDINNTDASISRSVTPSNDIFKRTQTFLADTGLETAAKHAIDIVSAVPSFELHLQVRSSNDTVIIYLFSIYFQLFVLFNIYKFNVC